jgi:hypothetical protein
MKYNIDDFLFTLDEIRRDTGTKQKPFPDDWINEIRGERDGRLSSPFFQLSFFCAHPPRDRFCLEAIEKSHQDAAIILEHYSNVFEKLSETYGAEARELAYRFHNFPLDNLCILVDEDKGNIVGNTLADLAELFTRWNDFSMKCYRENPLTATGADIAENPASNTTTNSRKRRPDWAKDYLRNLLITTEVAEIKNNGKLGVVDSWGFSFQSRKTAKALLEFAKADKTEEGKRFVNYCKGDLETIMALLHSINDKQNRPASKKAKSAKQ